MKKILAVLIFSTILLTGCGLFSQQTKPIVPKVAPVGGELPQPVGDTLDLSDQKLTKVPTNIFNQTNLEALNLSSNQLTGALPAEIRLLKNLKVLNASNNQMTGVPAEIGQLSKLEVLDLSNNQLTGLPNELGNLKNLKVLNISGNKYSEQDLKYITDSLATSTQIIK